MCLLVLLMHVCMLKKKLPAAVSAYLIRTYLLILRLLRVPTDVLTHLLLDVRTYCTYIQLFLLMHVRTHRIYGFG